MCRHREVAAAYLWSAFILMRTAVAAAPGHVDYQADFAVVPLTLNGVARGDVRVFIATDDVLVHAEDLERAGLNVAFAPTTRLSEGLFVSMGHLEPFVRYTFDRDALLLVIDAAPEKLGHSQFPVATQRPSGLRYAEDTSLFVNYAVQTTYTETMGAALTLNAEAGLSVMGQLFYSSLLRDVEGPVVRGISYAVHDDRDRLVRYTAGDGLTGRGGLGGALMLGGFHAERNFSIDPYFVRFPTLGLAGAVSSPSTVDIYNNGMLVRREAVQPGTFAIQNLPPALGSGAVQMVVRDAFGDERVITYPYYSASSLLDEGLSDFQASLGFPRLDQDRSSFSYGPLSLEAYGAYGLTRRLTVGGRFEAQWHLASGDVRLSVAPPFGGQFELDVAASRSAGRPGYAASLAYNYLERHVSVGALARVFSRAYANLSLAPTDVRNQADGSVMLGVPLGTLLSCFARYGLLWPFGALRQDSQSLSLTASVATDLSLLASVSRTRLPSGASLVEGSVGLTYVLGPRTTASAQRLEAAVPHNALAMQRVMPVGEGLGYRAELDSDDSTEVYGNGVLDYQAPVGRYSLYYQRLPNLAGMGAWTAAAAGAVVYMDYGLHFSRPVRDSFALVRVPGVAHVTTFIDNQQVGMTNGDGEVLVPNLLPYYGNRLSISDADVPFAYAINDVEKMVAPPLRGGAVVQFEAAPTRNYSGTIVLERDGKTYVPLYGEMVITDRAQTMYTSPIGEGGEFYWQNVPSGEHRVEVLFMDEPCFFYLTIPAASAVVHDLGALRCVMPKPPSSGQLALMPPRSRVTGARLRLVTLAVRALPLFVTLALPQPAWAALLCGINSTGNISFGSYNVFTGTAASTTGSVVYQCVSLGLGNVVLDLSTGGSGSYATRLMSGAPGTVGYNLYTDAACTSVWGNGTSGTNHYVFNPGLLSPITVTIYGCMAAGQDVASGSYTDTITVTINY